MLEEVIFVCAFKKKLFVVVKDELLLHQMRCLEALGRWQELDELGEQNLFMLQQQTSGDGGAGGTADEPTRYFSGNESLNGHLNLSSNEAETRQKILHMTARSCWAMGNT